MARQTYERRALAGMFKSLDPNWNGEAIKAYAKMIRQLEEENFSTSLHKEIFTKIKEHENIGECLDIKEVINEFSEDVRDRVEEILRTPGYPSTKDVIMTLKERIEQQTSQG